jgi:hypothetical protein
LVDVIKLFIFWNLVLLLNLFAKIRKEKIILDIIEILGAVPVLVLDKETGKMEWRIRYVEKIIYE